MNNRRIAGIVTAVIGLCAIMAFFNAGMDTSLLSWPLETYLGVAFTIGWLTSIHATLAYLLAALIFILLAIGFYKLGSWIYGLVVKK